MNAHRRIRIKELLAQLNKAREEVESILEDEQSAFENMPESLQSSERGEKSQECIDVLESAEGEIQSIHDNLEALL